MPVRSVRIWLEDILNEIAGIRSLTKDATVELFSASWPMTRAVQHALLIIAEAAKHVPTDMKAAHPEIAWRDIHGLGNLLRHDYRRIDPRILWSVVTGDLDALDRVVQLMLEELPPERM